MGPAPQDPEAEIPAGFLETWTEEKDTDAGKSLLWESLLIPLGLFVLCFVLFDLV